MSGADDLLQSVARLNAALDRIAGQATRLRADQTAFHDVPADTDREPVSLAVPVATDARTEQAEAPFVPATAGQSASPDGSATPNADIAARLDHLIEQLRVALSATTG